MSDQKKESTCWGCNEGALNQQGHMDFGGCLYDYTIEPAVEIEDENKTETAPIENKSDQKKESSCWGCNEGIANQQGHMDFGGCLYMPIEDEEDEEDSKTATSHKTHDTGASKTCK